MRNSLTGHRATPGPDGRCVTCSMTLVDLGRGPQHQQGWAGRQERMRLGLPVREGVPKPGTRAAVVAEQRDRIALLERENESLRRRVEQLAKAARGEALIARMERVAVRLERLFEMGLALDAEEAADPIRRIA